MKLRIAKKVLAKHTHGIFNEWEYGDGLYYIGRWINDESGKRYYDKTYYCDQRLLGRIDFVKAQQRYNKWLRRGCREFNKTLKRLYAK